MHVVAPYLLHQWLPYLGSKVHQTTDRFHSWMALMHILKEVQKSVPSSLTCLQFCPSFALDVKILDSTPALLWYTRGLHRSNCYNYTHDPAIYLPRVGYGTPLLPHYIPSNNATSTMHMCYIPNHASITSLCVCACICLCMCVQQSYYRNLVLFRTLFNFVRCRPYEN